jgi:undecaprenyl-diphosphatase
MRPDVYRALWEERDRRWAERVHRAVRHTALISLLRGVSWFGDGVLWYGTIVLLALAGGTNGRDVAAQMVMVGAFNLTQYLWLKTRICRARPYVKCPDIRARGRALDQFSFPSGHALHACAFSVMLIYYFPVTAWLLVPAAALICVSRVVLGLHYPSDVAAGAAIGGVTATGFLALF